MQLTNHIKKELKLVQLQNNLSAVKDGSEAFSASASENKSSVSQLSTQQNQMQQDIGLSDLV
jgi:hypothetical protein